MRNVNASDPLLNAQHVAGCYERGQGESVWRNIKIYESCGLKYLWRFISTQKYIQDYRDNLTQQQHYSFRF